MKKVETICWTCQNFSKCSWSNGVPVRDWEAEKVMGWYGTESYIVKKCPEYKEDKQMPIQLAEIEKIIDLPEWKIRRCISNEKQVQIKELLKQKGYKLYVYEDEKCKYKCYIEKLEGK